MSLSGTPNDQLAPASRQRLRFEALLGGLSEEEWITPSRCSGWTIHDVAAHLVGVNSFWSASLAAGLAGRPTRVLGGFDPVDTPELMVAQMRGLTRHEVLVQLARTTDVFVEAISGLDDDDWSMLAEAPPGHLSIRLMVQHALWDCWIHERDIAIPFGMETPVEPDEVRSCLVYAAALTSVSAVGGGHQIADELAVRATDPSLYCSLAIGESVTIRADYPQPTAPCLEGDAVALVEGLSLRAPFPNGAPVEWQQVIDGFAERFSADRSHL